MADSPRSTGIHCLIVTPETTAVDTQARAVVLPLEDGQLGVGRDHAPLIGRLGAGEVRITTGEGAEAVQRVFVDGGFVEVGHNVVTVITQRAIPAAKVDVAAARAALAEASSRPATGDEAIEARLRSQRAAREILRVAERSR